MARAAFVPLSGVLHSMTFPRSKHRCRCAQVSVTHPNVQAAADAQPEKFTIAKNSGILATDEVLSAVRDDLGTYVLG